MTIYEDLRQRYGQWKQANSDYWFNSGRYASNFADGLREYLGAPESFNDPATGTRRSYVQLCEVVDDAQSPGGWRLKPAKFHSALSLGDDGFLTFGVAVILERGPNTFPKSEFDFSIGMLARGERCTLRIAGEEFDVDVKSDASRGPAYQHMVKQLENWLAMEPWDMGGNKNPIGFVHHQVQGSSG